jgi:hypothetical protein
MIARIFRISAFLAILLIALVVEVVFFYESGPAQPRFLFAPKAPTVITDAYICGEKTNLIAVPTGGLSEVRSALVAAGEEAIRHNCREAAEAAFIILTESVKDRGKRA